MLQRDIADDIPVFRVPEFDAVRSAVGDCRGLRVLDAGCGTGQFSAALKQADSIAVIDLSLNDLKQREFRSSAQVVCGNVTAMPFPANSFDAAICTSVISHLPGPEQRRALLMELARVLRPGGKLVITTMHFNFRFQRKGTPQESYEDGVYYRKYLVNEFRSELAAHFVVTELWGLWNYLPKTYRIYLALGKHVIPWERFVRTKQISLKYGKFLLAICRKKPL
jgi:ubiquinone/menaquinone biosynthesis C-methylase UbiE